MQALVGNFNHSDICWKSSTVNCKQSRKVLECTEDNFLVQMMDSSLRGGALLDQLLTDALNFIMQEDGKERQGASLAKNS